MTNEQLEATQLVVSIVGTVIGGFSLIAIVVYVIKTWQIADATARSAAATEAAARATEQSAGTSEGVLSEMKEAREAESAPYVIASFEPDDKNYFFSLVIKNIGRSAASNVQAEFDPPLSVKLSGNDRSQPRFLSEPIPYMPPNFELRSILCSIVEAFQEGSAIPRRYHARISYTDTKTGKALSGEYILDFSPFEKAVFTTHSTINDIHDALKTIGKEQAATTRAMQEIGKNLSRGISISNSSLLVDSEMPGRSADEFTRLKLAEVLSLLQAWRSRDEDARYTSFEELRTVLRGLRNQLQRVAAVVDDEALLAHVGICDRLLAELIRHRFYIDGGASLRALESKVDEVVEIMARVAATTTEPAEQAVRAAGVDAGEGRSSAETDRVTRSERAEPDLRERSR